MNDDTRQTIHVISAGAFGRAVAASLRTLVPHTIETSLEPSAFHPSRWPVARMHLLAAWRPVPAVSRTLDEMSHAWRTPFIEAVMDTPFLRVGPIVVPGSGACHACAERRALQHSPRPREHQAVREHYDAHPQQGPHGFLPAFAAIAAARLADAVRDLDRDPAAAAGRVWRMHMIQRDTTSATVVGIHGCPRCGLGRDEATRSVLRLTHVVRDLVALDATTEPVVHDEHALVAAVRRS